MIILKKQAPVQQTKFTETQAVFEDPVQTANEQMQRQQRQQQIRKITFFVVGGVLLLGSVILLLQFLLNRPEPQIIPPAIQTPTPTASEPLSPLMVKILEARDRTEAIDLRDVELSLPQVDYALRLDEVKK